MDQQAYDQLYLRPPGLSLTGAGTVLGVTDGPALLNQPIYAENIIASFEVNKGPEEYVYPHEMHGAAVLSIAVGKHIGIAPGAKVVYGVFEAWKNEEYALTNLADSLREYQRHVINGGQLDAISASKGWAADNSIDPRFTPKEVKALDLLAVELNSLSAWFEERNIPFFNTTDRKICSCGPDGLAFWVKTAMPNRIGSDAIAVPVHNRLLACFNHAKIEEAGSLYYRGKEGGDSWAVPWIAGAFMLAREAVPGITREQFKHALIETSRTIRFTPECFLPVPDLEAFEIGLRLPRPDGGYRYNHQKRPFVS